MGAGALVVEEGEVERGGCEGEAGEEVGDDTHLLDKQCRFLNGASRSEPVSEIIRVWLLRSLKIWDLGINSALGLDDRNLTW